MTLRRKPIEVDGAWLLTDHDGKTALEWMFSAITTLTPLGWRGTPLPNSEGVIDRVEFAGNDGVATQAAFGKWVVLDDGNLKVLTVEECEELYEPTTGE